MQQDRNIAGKFDKNVNQATGDPVVGKPDYTKQKSQNGRRNHKLRSFGLVWMMFVKASCAMETIEPLG